MINGYNLKEVLQLVSAQWDSPCEERGRAHEAWGCLEPEVLEAVGHSLGAWLPSLESPHHLS